MRVTHLAVDLRLRNKGCNGIDNHDVHCTGAHHRLGDLKTLFSVVRLGNVEIVNVDTDVLRVKRIKGMLCIDESGNSASLLYLCHHMKCNRRLTTRLWSVNLNHTSLRHTAQSECNVQTDRAGRSRLDIHICSGISKFHDRSLAVGLLNLCNRRIQCFQLIIFIHVFLHANIRSFFAYNHSIIFRFCQLFFLFLTALSGG